MLRCCGAAFFLCMCLVTGERLAHVQNANSAVSVERHSHLCSNSCLQNLEGAIGWLLPQFVKDKVKLAMRSGIGAIFGAVTDNVRRFPSQLLQTF